MQSRAIKILRKLPEPAETRRELKALGADPDNEPAFAQQIPPHMYQPIDTLG